MGLCLKAMKFKGTLDSARIPYWKRRLVVVGTGYLVSLCVMFLFAPPAAAECDLVVPALSAAALMLFFGPYLLAVGCTTGFLPDAGALLGIAAMIPLYVAHLYFLSVLSRQTSLWGRMHRFGEYARKSVVVLFGAVSTLGIVGEMPCVSRYEFDVGNGKIPADGLRMVVVTDLHSCRYGSGQRILVDEVRKQNPDVVLLSGDIFDDRLPDDNAMMFVGAIAKDYPCLYVFGNHEHWSERIPEVRNSLQSAEVTVLEGTSKTITIRNTEIDFFGIDDPTYMVDAAWLGQLASVAAKAAVSPRLRILLSHRGEYANEYRKYDFDFIFSGHLHGGQWRVPWMDVGLCGPSSGGPESAEAPLFPRHAGGAYAIGDHTTMIVSRGLARESTPLPRFFNNPQLVVVDLKLSVDDNG